MRPHLVLIDILAAYWKKEPAVVVGVCVSGVVALAGSLGFVLDSVRVEAIVAPLLASLIARTQVYSPSSVAQIEKRKYLEEDSKEEV